MIKFIKVYELKWNFLYNSWTNRVIDHSLFCARVENSLNDRGLKASDLTELFPRELRTLKMQRLLMDPESSLRSQTKKHPSKSSGTILTDAKADDDQDPKPRSFRGKTMREKCWRKWFEYLKHGGIFSQQSLNSLMVVATVITTMTFQGAISPPGGVWQKNVIQANNSDFDYSKQNICTIGTAVFGYSKKLKDDYKNFVAYNNISFLASLAVILLLISGVPLRNKFGTWDLGLDHGHVCGYEFHGCYLPKEPVTGEPRSNHTSRKFHL